MALALWGVIAGCGDERRARHGGDSASPPASSSVATAPCSAATITGDGVGAVQIGAPLDSVRARCVVLRDTTELRDEGMPARLLTIPLGADNVEAEIVRSRVWRIAIETPTLRTADSLAVGTPLARVLALPGAHGLRGEGRLFVASPARCGLSFQLSVPDTGLASGDLDVETLRTLPPSTTVSRILIVGCRAVA